MDDFPAKHITSRTPLKLAAALQPRRLLKHKCQSAFFFPSQNVREESCLRVAGAKKKVFRRKEKLHHPHFHADAVPAGCAALRFFALYREKRRRIQAGLPSLSRRISETAVRRKQPERHHHT